MLHAKNDSQRLKDELIELRTKNKPLLDLIVDLYHYVEDNLHKDVVITMIYRTPQEQDSIYSGTYRGSRAYDTNPWKSPHQVWTAIDIRTSIYSSTEINQIRDYINNKYNSSNYYKTTAMYHEVIKADGTSLAHHFHIQFSKQ